MPRRYGLLHLSQFAHRLLLVDEVKRRLRLPEPERAWETAFLR
jgi:hypothetical protein